MVSSDGTGRWRREANGQWTLVRFRVYRFDVLDKTSLRDAVAALRAIPGSGWDELDDPLAELREIQGKDELH